VATGPGTPTPEIPYECLSDEALETITTIALPITAGLSYSEVAERLEIPESEVSARMKQLRGEIRSWQDFSF
jgi:hypothetical protein